MAPLQLLVAAAGLFLSQSSASATPAMNPAPEVELPVEVPAPPANAAASVATQDSPLPTQIMRVLGVLETVGVVEIDKSSKLVSEKGVVDTASLPVRAPSWLPVGPETPTMPILYSRMMQLRF
jgi:hypothetical protein